MNSRIQTTIDSAQSTVLLLSPGCVFTTQLKIAIQAVHLDVVVISPQEIQKTLLKEEGRKLFQNSYVCLWIDLPIFTQQHEKEDENKRILTSLQKFLRAPFHIITFDAFYDRKNGREGGIPTVASRTLIQSVLELFPSADFFSYTNVVYPYEQGASVTSRFLLEKIGQGTRQPLEGEWSPLWYEDVIAHIVATLYDLEKKGGIFTGPSDISLESFEESLRKISHLHGLLGKRLVFPFVFEEGIRIGKTQIPIMLEELSLVVPHSSFQPSKPEEPVKTVFPQKKIRPSSIKRRKKFQKAFKTIGIIGGLAFAAYAGIAILFFSLLGNVRETVFMNAKQQSSLAWDSKTISDVNQKVNILERISTFVPFPYSLVGIMLPQEGVVEGLRSVARLTSGIQAYHQATQLLEEQIQSSADRNAPNTISSQQITSLLEESYKDLSTIQADITKGNPIFDSLFGMDGLSSQIVSSTISFRETITQEKAVVSFVESILAEKEQTVLAIVAVDSSRSRPLFGVPTEVTVLTLNHGKIVSTQTYPVEELDLLLKGKVEPPSDMKKFAISQSWKLSDGSWSADGPTASREIAWFINKQLHVDVENVLFVDTQALALGMNKKESGPESVLGAQTSTPLLSDILSAGGNSNDILPTLIDSLNSSRVVLFSRDAGIAKTAKSLAWDGAVRTPTCPSVFALEKQCIVSTRYLSEYDLSLPSDKKLLTQKNNQVHQIHISKEFLLHSDLVSYPRSTEEGERKLLKYLIDADAESVVVTVNGAVQDGNEITVGKEYEKTSVTLPISLSITSETVVTLTYSTKSLLAKDSSLAFFAQKQPGKSSDPFTLELSFAKDYIPSSIAPKGLIDRSGVSFTTTLDTSKIFAVGF